MKKIRIILLLILTLLVLTNSAYSFWIWSPKTKKWMNPVYRTFNSPEKQFEWSKGFFDDKEYRKAISEFKKLLRKFPKSEYAPEAKYFIGLSLEKLKKYNAAYNTYQQLIVKYPLTKRLEDTVEHQYLIGEIFFKLKKYDRARQIFAKVLVNAPYSKVSDSAQFNIGMSLFKMRDYADAKSEFGKVIDNYGFSPYVDDASFYRGLCTYKIAASVKFYDEGLVNQAIGDFQDFLNRYQTSEYDARAEVLVKELKDKKAERLYRVACFYEKGHKKSAALKYLEELLSTYPNSSWAVKGKQKAEKLKKQLKIK